jgi:hypothetical protein
MKKLLAIILISISLMANALENVCPSEIKHQNPYQLEVVFSYPNLPFWKPDQTKQVDLHFEVWRNDSIHFVFLKNVAVYRTVDTLSIHAVQFKDVTYGDSVGYMWIAEDLKTKVFCGVNRQLEGDPLSVKVYPNQKQIVAIRRYDINGNPAKDGIIQIIVYRDGTRKKQIIIE